MPDDNNTPTPRWTLAALLRAPLSDEDIAMLVERLHALAAADQDAHDRAPNDAEDDDGRE